MSLIRLCLMSLLLTAHLFLISSVVSDQKIDPSQLRVFPAAKHSIAGVFQVTYINNTSGPQYAFSAVEAREICWSLGLTMASKAQVQQALKLGLETCRFGWIDEHFAVIPRIKASTKCGNNKTGLVNWRAVSVRRKFDVFCFNESDMVTQLKDATDDSLQHTPFPPEATTSTSDLQPAFPTHSVSSSTFLHSHPNSIDSEAAPPQMRSSAQGSIGVPAKALVITSICAFLLTAAAIFAYMKMSKSSFLSWDVKQQEEYTETEECTCMRIKDPKKDAEEDFKIEVANNKR